jgi:uncharacterized protein
LIGFFHYPMSEPLPLCSPRRAISLRATILGALAALATAACSPSALAADSELSIDGPIGALKGAIAGPGTCAAPTAVIIPGSGPTDRDGNNRFGIRAATYRLLAEALSKHGITTVRVDKRGMFSSADAIENANDVTITDYASDTRHWVSAMRARTGAQCAWVIGHSEGGLVALAAAQNGADGMCGVVLVSTPGRRLSDTLRSQFNNTPDGAALVPDLERILASLESGQRVEQADIPQPLAPLFAPSVQGFVMDLLSYDPAALASRIAKPVLVVQGEADIQVGVDDAQRLKKAAPKSSLLLLPKTSHTLKVVAGDDRAANLATYTAADLPIVPEAVDGIAKFLVANTPTPKGCITPGH